VLDLLFTTDAMRAVFSDDARVQRMLDFEAALARAEAKCGVIPAAAAEAIGRCCRASDFDFGGLATAARTAGNLAIPLVAALTERVGGLDAAARGFVHWGATSQDVIDTALVMQLREALRLIERGLARLADALAAKADAHRATPLPGRTWLQQAVPVTLGLKLATSLSAIDRHRVRIAELQPRVAVLQFGGAVGTLASLGTHGLAVERALAAELELAIPDVPWHTQRDIVCDVATTLGLLAATLGKLGRDTALLAQTEVGEAFEPAAPGRGGSSTLPNKRNPVGAAIAIAAATRIPGLVATMLAAAVQEHERGLGNWPAEWDTLPQIVMLAAGSLDAMAEVVAGLDIDAARMRANLELSQGQLFTEASQMALAPALGRDIAHELVAAASRKASRERRHLRDVLGEEPRVRAVLDATALAQLFDPQSYLGASDAFVARALAHHARSPASASSQKFRA
jgi:3-carboxy-cis,cis-muconate cycloisomerase